MAAAPPPVNLLTLLAQDAAHSYGGLTLPAAPQQPPTNQDIVDAIRFARRVAGRHSKQLPPEEPEHVSRDAFSASAQYEHAVIQQSLEVAGTPAWFQAWDNQVFQPAMNRANAQIAGVEGDVTTLMIQIYKERNSEFVVDDNGPLFEVRFPDGRKPWGLAVAGPNGNVVLPPLINAAALRNLTLAESYGYYRGYYPNLPMLNAGPNTIARRLERIAVAIGFAL